MYEELVSPTERVSKMTFWLLEKGTITTVEAAKVCGVTYQGARQMLLRMARVLPMDQFGGTWIVKKKFLDRHRPALQARLQAISAEHERLAVFAQSLLVCLDDKDSVCQPLRQELQAKLFLTEKLAMANPEDRGAQLEAFDQVVRLTAELLPCLQAATATLSPCAHHYIWQASWQLEYLAKGGEFGPAEGNNAP